MKPIKIAILILAFMFLYSCRNDENCTWWQEVTSISSSYLQYGTGIHNIEENDTIPSRELMVNVGFHLQDVSTHLECTGENLAKNEIDSEISNFTITTVYNFNQQFSAGDTMNGCFELYSYNYINSHEGFSYFSDISSLNEYTNTFPVQNNGNIFLLLNSSTDSLRLVQFNINYRETDGSEFTCTTPLVFLNP